jgi:hypothetical protein
MNLEISIGWWALITLFLLVFALILVIVGIFTAYFGSGKSRVIGAGLLVIGLVIGLVWGYIVGPAASDISSKVWLKDLIIGWIAIIGVAILAAVAAIGLFLLVIMKS